MNISACQKIAYEIAKEHGFHETDRNVGEVLALFHSEISEAFEEWRNGKGLAEIYFVDDKPEGFPIELADLLIRVFDSAEEWNIDLEEALNLKMEYNRTRPYKHGGKLA